MKVIPPRVPGAKVTDHSPYRVSPSCGDLTWHGLVDELARWQGLFRGRPFEISRYAGDRGWFQEIQAPDLERWVGWKTILLLTIEGFEGNPLVRNRFPLSMANGLCLDLWLPSGLHVILSLAGFHSLLSVTV